MQKKKILLNNEANSAELYIALSQNNTGTYFKYYLYLNNSDVTSAYWTADDQREATIPMTIGNELQIRAVRIASGGPVGSDNFNYLIIIDSEDEDDSITVKRIYTTGSPTLSIVPLKPGKHKVVNISYSP